MQLCVVWSTNCIAFRCQTCAYSPYMTLYTQCFHEGDHEGHEFKMYRSAGGFCDCGDKNLLRETGFCPRHGLYDEPNPLPGLFAKLSNKLE
ncbi:hypothetical protein JTE90_008502 [Oedothorax gibbosus]|uniref:E3 ubiquitin-protein ligase n=1 Tax=Oedothorax gibbosus TaxID=931172 RepID=A0AAV6V0N3_9ARAC|nr:hypothetical protein JTE90_008502 [Oedothorax gibbosus]